MIHFPRWVTPPTPCQTRTNSFVCHTVHGVVRHESTISAEWWSSVYYDTSRPSTRN